MTTSRRHQGRIALVTGGSRGIGRAISRRLAAEGALVAVHYGHDHEAAGRTVEEIEADGGRAFAVHAELGVPQDAATLWAAFDQALAGTGSEPGLDILVNNAGITLPRPVAAVTEEEYDRVFAVNTRAPFFIVQRALERLRDGGRIISISSAATRTAYPAIVAYSMSKGALDTLTPALAKQLGPRGITVNTVAPGFTETEINPTLSNPEIRKALSSASVFDRLGAPADIADVVSFVASEEARWVTGQWIDATGGVGLGL
ncbi:MULTISPECIES: SDR family oxidoreductase [Streptomyces]|uniref:Short-chain dehydrogenase n=4 Tax=Streptomyces TaxID=1883 RepID=A0A8H9HM06_9ACTN|nr:MULTISPECIES: SDR family oxidoreductase [Streptomyces]NEE29764.1 SDR family oxidoreductase [Streptomyces sp. SID7982]NEE43983.1 SDR family oxidoreductase [Streptomyces sp. SID8455]MBL3808142.1 SDR family oxidoreductase [Streptomyces sp. BRB081]MDQ0297299.1 NAD(P)-dependent dehydrogenase (short-subunit alcohol dehydrogenase family) [Streptomyces sp. DSM 41037]PJM81484.1 short-chain dehydrogenase [Streptomyces sp. TSRI0384-2]